MSWWKSGIIYQIYPRSFKDTTGNGIGDLQGIIEKLDYLQDLGINAIWLCPIYKSPMVDFGYDVVSFTEIHPEFGTIEDFNALVTKAHKRNIRIIMDYVANHTSDQHPWFLKSKTSRTNPKSDYYIWKDAKPDGSPPTNWLCAPGYSAWTWSEERQQYYYHSFLSCQPDVNWENPAVQGEMLNVLKFWLDKGVDGYRIDMISWLYKDPEWRDNPINTNYDPKTDFKFDKLIPKYTIGLPGLYTYLELISKTVHSYDNKLLIGETLYETPLKEYHKFYGIDGNLIDLPANFKLIITPWSKEEILLLLNQYYTSVPSFGWPNFQFGNHDVSRMVSKFGSRKIARGAAIFLLTLRGTPFIYNGEELGMIDGIIQNDKIKDPTATHDPKLSRDPYRTPMLWNSEKNAGFTVNEPWLSINPDYQENNVEKELQDSSSFLNLYKQLIKLRQSNEALTLGDIRFNDLKHSYCIFYDRILNSKKKFGIIINFSDKEESLLIDNHFKIILNSFLDDKSQHNDNNLLIRGTEAIIIQYID